MMVVDVGLEIISVSQDGEIFLFEKTITAVQLQAKRSFSSKLKPCRRQSMKIPTLLVESIFALSSILEESSARALVVSLCQ